MNNLTFQVNIEDLHRMNNLTFQNASSKPDHILESNVDEEEWRLEVERVLPSLRVTLKSDTRDWRSHLDQIRTHKQRIEETMKAAEAHLDKLSNDMGTSLNKIATREKMLNEQLSEHLARFRTAQDELRHVTERYRELSVGVGERQKQLNKLSEELNSVKQEMDQRGSSMTDGSPLINIKKAISMLKSELKSINIQIGVADHTLLQARLRDKTSVQNNAKISAVH
uniref:Intraflagellar transport protein 57 homolog n=2 Tax=Cacopsylla melanoneura TaxID=428564 RepID=A0A8D8S1M7_9HEMI